jgi:hypothetical protein
MKGERRRRCKRKRREQGRDHSSLEVFLGQNSICSLKS